LAPAAAPASAAESNQYTLNKSQNITKGEGSSNSLFGDGGTVTTIINIMLYIIGILCVAMLIYGGIRYTTSGGKQESVTSAKNTIMYSLIGLVIAIIAWAVVNFVIGGLAENDE
jgi:ABC-type Fe3+ transport system permease subunit